MSIKKLITITPTCPECETEFETEIEERDLLVDIEDPLNFKCPDCDAEFEQKYSYSQATGIVVLIAEVVIIVAGEQAEEDDESEDDEDADDLEEGEEDEEDEDDAEG